MAFGGEGIGRLAPGFRNRELRQRVALSVRIRVADVWSDATILNWSSRGLMLRSSVSPSPRSYVEIRRGLATPIIGKVVWAADAQFGVRTQDRVYIQELTSCAPARAPHGKVEALGDRRAVPRKRTRSVQQQLEHSAHMSAIIQFVVIVAFGAGCALLAERTIVMALAKPLQTVSDHL
ncbi:MULTISPECIES: hypothetical protein [unclassified Sphingomonas]|uniref:hypothetical protein n=1 Tax=unclassified Sphingomonas TaxID=196159 RepID=UPI00226AD65C|nr:MULTISPECIES: hypothetical protein [unclassified Sphingomonas]